MADYNADPNVHGILVQLPLPKHINEQRVLDAISIEKVGPAGQPGLRRAGGASLPQLHPSLPQLQQRMLLCLHPHNAQLPTPLQDVDGFHPLNIGALAMRGCAPAACMAAMQQRGCLHPLKILGHVLRRVLTAQSLLPACLCCSLPQPRPPVCAVHPQGLPGAAQAQRRAGERRRGQQWEEVHPCTALEGSCIASGCRAWAVDPVHLEWLPPAPQHPVRY